MLTLGAVRGSDTHQALRGGDILAPLDICKSTHAFELGFRLVLDRSTEGWYSKKQNEILKKSVEIWSFFKILSFVLVTDLVGVLSSRGLLLIYQYDEIRVLPLCRISLGRIVVI